LILSFLYVCFFFSCEFLESVPVRCLLQDCEDESTDPNDHFIGLKGIVTHKEFDIMVSNPEKNIRLVSSFHRQQGIGRYGYAYHKAMVEYTVKTASILIFDFMDEIGLKNQYKECRTPRKLNIYHIAPETLLDPRRFNQFPKENRSTRKSGHVLWALFDPKERNSETSAIYLTDKETFNQELLAHEISHYWYERMCIYRVTTYDTESFAQRFQKYYMQRTRY